ncbi:MAG: EFR1 family ferrodoxin [Saccharofermentans sp.]|nr:EFR1 family ferrodoxin [Saccharofermentans sp.]
MLQAESRWHSPEAKALSTIPSSLMWGATTDCAGDVLRDFIFNVFLIASSKLKINADKCVGCGLCVKLCPMNNISVESEKAVPASQCTMCYRCINKCPKQAITLLGKKVVEQSVIEKYV